MYVFSEVKLLLRRERNVQRNMCIVSARGYGHNTKFGDFSILTHTHRDEQNCLLHKITRIYTHTHIHIHTQAYIIRKKRGVEKML